MENKLISYAYSFTDYLLSNLKNPEKIEAILLYGSVAKNEAEKTSDVDIFIDTDDSKMKKNAQKLRDSFSQTKDFLRFKAKGVENEISIITGKLDDWKNLKRSIMSSGIVLYGKYQGEKPKSTHHMVLFFWEHVGKNRGAFLNKLYGYTLKGKKLPGMLEEYKGIKSGKSSIIIPIIHKDEFIKEFKKYQVKVQSRELFM